MPQRQVSKQRRATIASKNLIHSAELAVLVPIKRGLVEISSPMTYGRRLELLLESLFDLRKDGVERSHSSFVGPLEQLQTIHNVHWCVFDDGQPVHGALTQTKKLLLVVSFDQPWEPYIRRIVDQAGPLLDLIFCHCEGFEGHSSKDGYDAFATFVRRGQRECQYFASANPELTVDDQRYLKQFKELQVAAQPAALPLDAVIAPLAPRRPAADEGDRLYRLLGELFRTRSLFPEVASAPPRNGEGAPVNDERGSTGEGKTKPLRTDREYYDAAAQLLIRGFLPAAPEPRRSTRQLLTRLAFRLGSQHRGLLEWYKKHLHDIETHDVNPELADPKPPTPEELAPKLQRGILESYPVDEVLTHGCLVMLQFKGEERLAKGVDAFLDRLRQRVSETPQPGALHYNVAFTYQGLHKLFDNTVLRCLPVEFQVGMEERAGLLGDLGQNHPSRWVLPRVNLETDLPRDSEVRLTTVDLVVTIVGHLPGQDGDHRWGVQRALVDAVASLRAECVRLLHVQPLRRYESRRQPTGHFKEHFGYVDGVSQPDPFATRGGSRATGAAVGDFLLGRIDSHGEESPSPHPSFNDGSFLVIRKLRQDAQGFDTFIREQAPQLGVPERVLRAKLMGRKDDGTPLANKAEQGASSNDFDYDEDADGIGCPLQAHVRRANPRFMVAPSVHGRATGTPRLMRRGFPYGPESGTDEERGLVFMAYNASIAQQFEVIQRWLNGGNVTGLSSDQNDPIVGAADSARPRRFSFKTETGVKSLSLDRSFVALEWGLYLFAPSLHGLAQFAVLARDRADEALAQQARKELEAKRIAEGSKLIDNLFRIQDHVDPEDPNAAEREWKKILEDEGLEDEAQKIWAAIRAKHQGVLRTDYGVLVGGRDIALHVLRTESQFSVRGYMQRMQDSFGAMHLGMDRVAPSSSGCPAGFDQKYRDAILNGELDYDRDSVINEPIFAITRGEAFRWARHYTLDAFKSAGSSARGFREAPLPTMDLALLTERVVSLLSSVWFGFPTLDQLPEVAFAEQHAHPRPAPAPVSKPATLRISGTPERQDDPHAYCPYDFTVASQYIFRPNPDPWAVTHAQKRGASIKNTAQTFVAGLDKPSHPFLQFLEQKFPKQPPAALDGGRPDHLELRRRGLVGAVDGFTAATFGSVLSVLDRWVEDDDLFAHHQRFHGVLAEAMRALDEADDGLSPAELAQMGRSEQLKRTVDLPEAFERTVVETLKLRLVPLWVHRSANHCLDLGPVKVEGGERVIINLGSAAADDTGTDMLFGGLRVSAEPRVTLDQPLHACPGREMAMGVLLGMISAIVMQKGLKRESRLLLSFDPD
jgi:Dyp-type peroxidase family